MLDTGAGRLDTGIGSQQRGRRDYAEGPGPTPVLILPVALIGGHLLAIGAGPFWCAALTAAAWIGALGIRNRRWARVLVLTALGSLLPGMAVEQGAAARLDELRADATVRGRIIDAQPPNAPRSLLVQVEAYDGPLPVPRRVRLTVYEPLALSRGESWQLPVRLRAPRGLANPGGGDPERNLFRAGIDAVGYVRPDGAERLEQGRTRLGPRMLRESLSLRIDETASGAGGRHLRALLTGDRSALTAADWTLLGSTGTTHLLVVSGLHVGMVAGMVLMLSAVTGLRARAPGATAALMLLAAGTFAVVSGFELPARRALIMLAVGAWLVAGKRSAHPVQGLAWAALAVLLLDPLAPLSAGFWLSFLAVTGLVLVLSGRVAAGMPWLRGTLLAQLTVTTLLTVPLAMAFGRVPIAAPLINLLAIPVVAMLVLPAGLILLIGLVAGVPGAGAGLSLLAVALETGLAGLAVLPDTVLAVTPVGGALLALAVGAAALVWAPWPWPLRLLGMVLLTGLLVPQGGAPEQGVIRLQVFDVGQGLAVVVRTRRHALLYDTGPPFGFDSDAGARVIVPALRAMGITSLDRIMVSHAHADHMGGLESVRAAFPGASVSGPTQLPGAAELCHQGQGWHWDGVDFEVLLPPPGVAGDPRFFNRHSCVLRVRSGDRALLLPGDVDVFAERRLAQAIGQKDVVVAPHHGSRTSSGRVLVGLTRPRFLLVPAGYPSPFGHPHPEVVERWREAGAVVLGSSAGGMLTWESSRPEKVVRERDGRRRYWNWVPPPWGQAYDVSGEAAFPSASRSRTHGWPRLGVRRAGIHEPGGDQAQGEDYRDDQEKIAVGQHAGLLPDHLAEKSEGASHFRIGQQAGPQVDFGEHSDQLQSHLIARGLGRRESVRVEGGPLTEEYRQQVDAERAAELTEKIHHARALSKQFEGQWPHRRGIQAGKDE